MKQKMIKSRPLSRRLGLPLAAAALSFALAVFTISLLLNLPRVVPGQVSASELIQFTKEDLSRYDGTDPGLPIYLALDSYVYDVTSGSRFYRSGGPYHSLAGKDSSELLHIAGGSIIKNKYPVVGILR